LFFFFLPRLFCFCSIYLFIAFFWRFVTRGVQNSKTRLNKSRELFRSRQKRHPPTHSLTYVTVFFHGARRPFLDFSAGLWAWTRDAPYTPCDDTRRVYTQFTRHTAHGVAGLLGLRWYI
jgi:hypothetical protein